MKKDKLIFWAALFFISVLISQTQGLCQNKDNSQKLHLITVKNSEELMNFFRYNNEALPLVSAHRGGALTSFPENCISTFENTLRHTYAIMECDPRYTKDSLIVLHHDPTLQRTTNGNGKLTDYTLKELKEIKLKDLNGNITEYRIPTLDEALEWAKGKTILVLDQKDVTVAQRVKKVEEHKAIANVILIVYSFDDAVLCYKLNKNIMMEVMIPDKEKAVEFEKTGVPWRNVVAFVGHNLPVDPVLYEFLHQKGVICMAGSSRTIDRKFLSGEVKDYGLLKNDYTGFLEKGIDLIETDLPSILGPLLYGTSPGNLARARYLKY
jgi:glycerophosphoryl diester phosphodiesterase